jgi:capsular polysaccharide biosynthesis protein
MKEPQPLRLSEWSSAGKEPPVPPVAPPATYGSTAPAPEPARERTEPNPGARQSARAASIPRKNPATIFQGFDLLRIPGGLLRRWWIPVPLFVGGMVLGLLAGLHVFEVSSTVSVRLMARNPQSFAVSTTSYVPSRLQGATLLGALASPQVAREVADKFGNKELTSGQLLKMIEVQEVRKTDFVDIVVTTPFDAQETAKLGALWAQEAMTFTSRLQSDESAEMNRYLKEQLRRTDAELERVNKEIIAMRREAGVVDVEKEIDVYLKSLGDLDLRYETARIDLESVEYQLAALRKEIPKHSPSFEELKTEEAKMQEMSDIYTDQNPIYQEEIERVKTLRAKVEKELSSTDVPLSDFTGTYVGNALYLQILDLESKHKNLLLQRTQLEEMRKSEREKLKDLPEKAMIAGPLLETSQSLRAAKDVLTKRLQEVAVFEEVAPGYYRLFKTPTARDVAVSSRKGKLIVVAMLGGFAFFGLGLVAAAGLEFLDSTVRTAAEAEVALQSPCLACLPRGRQKDAPALRPQQLWADVIGALSTGKTRVFWAPVAAARAGQFWDTLLEAGRSMDLRILLVHLAGEVPAELSALPRIAPRQLQSPPQDERVVLLELPGDLTSEQTREMSALIKAAQPVYQEIWIETAGLVREPAASVSREFSETILLCALGAADRNFWHTQRTLLATNRPLSGVVALG